MRAAKIKTLLETSEVNQDCAVHGWVKTFRANRFIALNDEGAALAEPREGIAMTEDVGVR